MTTSLLEKRKIIALAGRILKADGPKGQLTAVVNTGYLDRQGDIMAVGCWQKCIAEGQKPLLFWQHDYSQLPLGSASHLQELMPGDPRVPALNGKSSGTAGALLAQLDFSLDTVAGRDAFTLASQGHIREFSCSITNKPENGKTDYRGVRTVTLVDELLEISLVIKGASLGTYTLESKAAFQRLMSMPEWMPPLIEKVAEDAEDRMYLALQAAEDRAWYEGQHRAAVAEGIRVGRETLRQEVAKVATRQRELAEIARRTQVTVWKAQPRPAPRPLTEREKFEREIAFRAGVYYG